MVAAARRPTLARPLALPDTAPSIARLVGTSGLRRTQAPGPPPLEASIVMAGRFGLSLLLY